MHHQFQQIFELARASAILKMSDWEDEYDEDGHAIHQPAPQACLPGPKLHGHHQSEAAYRGQNSFAGPRVDGAALSRQSVRYPGGDTWGPPARGPGRRVYREASESDRRPPVVTLSVDSAKVGRVIGKFHKHKLFYFSGVWIWHNVNFFPLKGRGGAKIREVEESSGAKIKARSSPRGTKTLNFPFWPLMDNIGILHQTHNAYFTMTGSVHLIRA